MWSVGDTVTIDERPVHIARRMELQLGEEEQLSSRELFVLEREDGDEPWFVSGDDEEIQLLTWRPPPAGPYEETLSLRITAMEGGAGELDHVRGHDLRVVGHAPAAVDPKDTDPFAHAAKHWIFEPPLTGEAHALAGLDLVLDAPDRFHTARFPAADMSRYEIERTPAAGSFLGWLLAAVVAALALIRLQPGSRFPYILVFCAIGAGALVWRGGGRSSRAYVAAHLLSSALFLWVSTRLLHNLVFSPGHLGTATPWDTVHAAGCLGLLLLLYPLSTRLYHTVADAATWAGATSITLFTLGVLAYSCLDCEWHGGAYGRELGATPYGFIWAALLSAFLIYKLRDLGRVPLTVARFSQNVTELMRWLRSRPADFPKQAPMLARIADDLADACAISRDPRIASCAAYEERFRQLSQLLAGLPAHWPHRPADLAHVDADLAVLVADLAEVDAAIRRGKLDQPLRALRISPYLRAAVAADTDPD